MFAEVYDVDLQKELIVKTENLVREIDKLKEERYKAYQQWAINKLNDARKEWDSYNIVTDKRAIAMFNKYILEINPALLLPDVNTLYNSLYQLIYNELPNKAKAEMQYNKAVSSKVKKLEDF